MRPGRFLTENWGRPSPHAPRPLWATPDGDMRTPAEAPLTSDSGGPADRSGAVCGGLCPQKEMLACSPVPVPCCGPGVSAGASGSEAVPPRVAGRNPRRRRGEEWGARTEALGGAAAGRGSLGPGTEAPPGNLISDFQK